MAHARSQQPSRIVLGTALLLTCLHAQAARGTDLGAPVMTGDRSLSFLHTHTGKSISVVYYRDGSYVEEALARLNAFLADFRSGDAAQMDPRLFDILHELKMRSGTREPFQVGEIRSGGQAVFGREPVGGLDPALPHFRSRQRAPPATPRGRHP